LSKIQGFRRLGSLHTGTGMGDSQEQVAATVPGNTGGYLLKKGESLIVISRKGKIRPSEKFHPDEQVEQTEEGSQKSLFRGGVSSSGEQLTDIFQVRPEIERPDLIARQKKDGEHQKNYRNGVPAVIHRNVAVTHPVFSEGTMNDGESG
jgi:hypothetical protein